MSLGQVLCFSTFFFVRRFAEFSMQYMRCRQMYVDLTKNQSAKDFSQTWFQSCMINSTAICLGAKILKSTLFLHALAQFYNSHIQCCSRWQNIFCLVKHVRRLNIGMYIDTKFNMLPWENIDYFIHFFTLVNDGPPPMHF